VSAPSWWDSHIGFIPDADPALPAELRAAATELRTQAEGGFHPALADWLDHTAALIEGNSGRFEGTQSSGMALLTARAINGGAS